MIAWLCIFCLYPRINKHNGFVRYVAINKTYKVEFAYLATKSLLKLIVYAAFEFSGKKPKKLILSCRSEPMKCKIGSHLILITRQIKVSKKLKYEFLPKKSNCVYSGKHKDCFTAYIPTLRLQSGANIMAPKLNPSNIKSFHVDLTRF